MLAYLSIISLADEKSVTTNIFEIKYKKITIHWRMSEENHPAKCGLDWVRIERDMLNFRVGAERALPAPRVN